MDFADVYRFIGDDLRNRACNASFLWQNASFCDVLKRESGQSVYRRVFCGDQRTPSSCQRQNERIVYGGDGKITAERGFFLDGIDGRKHRCRGNGGSDRRQSDGKI